MGRAPCCSKVGLNKGPWTPREDTLLTKYIEAHGEGHWRSLPQKAGLFRCGKSCRLRWINYLRPGIKRGNITPDEDDLINYPNAFTSRKPLVSHRLIAGRLPGRTDNEIKNYWNTRLSKMLTSEGTDPNTHQKISQPPAPKDKKRKKKYHNAKSTSNNEKRLVPEKPKVYFPKPTRVTSFVNLPRNDSFTTARTSVSSSQDQVLDHVNNIMIPWSNFREGGVVFSSGDGSSPDFEFDDRSRITPNVTADDRDDHTLENIYDEHLQALLKTIDQDQNYQLTTKKMSKDHKRFVPFGGVAIPINTHKSHLNVAFVFMGMATPPKGTNLLWPLLIFFVVT